MNNVREQYENWLYPSPILDLEEDAKAGRFDRSDPKLFRRKLWPRPVEPAKLKILIAGCGTVQAARYAYRNPECDVVGVDLSQKALDHEAYLKVKHSLGNLRLHCLDILEIDKLGEQFDLIVSSGVLHHLPDPDAGLRQLKTVLLPRGVMSIMVYGWYTRFGVYMLQEAFRLLGVEQTSAGVAQVRETLAALPSWHHVKAYLRIAPDLDEDGGIVDTFLHPSDRAYTVKQVLRLARDNGLCFQDWLERHSYSIAALIPESLLMYPLAARLPPEEQWHLVELLSQALGTHAFLLCHPERDPKEYRVEFAGLDESAAWLNYVPHLRAPMEVIRPAEPDKGTSAILRRFTHEFTVAGPEVRMFELVDGNNTIGHIVQACSGSAGQLEDNRRLAFNFFARMHDRDHLLFQI